MKSFSSLLCVIQLPIQRPNISREGLYPLARTSSFVQDYQPTVLLKAIFNFNATSVNFKVTKLKSFVIYCYSNLLYSAASREADQSSETSRTSGKERNRNIPHQLEYTFFFHINVMNILEVSKNRGSLSLAKHFTIHYCLIKKTASTL